MARPGQQARSVSPTKRKQKALIKVTVGNKKMMAQEGISVSQTVDDYMREMEVTFLHSSKMASLAAQVAKYMGTSLHKSAVPSGRAFCLLTVLLLCFAFIVCTIRSLLHDVPLPAQLYSAATRAKFWIVQMEPISQQICHLSHFFVLCGQAVLLSIHRQIPLLMNCRMIVFVCCTRMTAVINQCVHSPLSVLCKKLLNTLLSCGKNVACE